MHVYARAHTLAHTNAPPAQGSLRQLFNYHRTICMPTISFACINSPDCGVRAAPAYSSAARALILDGHYSEISVGSF